MVAEFASTLPNPLLNFLFYRRRYLIPFAISHTEEGRTHSRRRINSPRARDISYLLTSSGGAALFSEHHHADRTTRIWAEKGTRRTVATQS